MAAHQLRTHKDEAHTKLRLALFTADLEDNKALAARVAHLESEWAGSALAAGRHADAQTGLVAAAEAYKTLGRLAPALNCLVRANSIPLGDAECRALLTEAIADLRKTMEPAPKPSKPAKPAPKTEKKPEAKPATEEKVGPAAEEKKPKKKKKKKAKKKP